jgi:uncharacterized phiE125 gp8 family phage protein
MLLNLRLTIPPTVEPVTLALAKQQMTLDAGFTADDALVAVYITAARQYAETYTNRAFFAQTWQMTLDHFPWFNSENGTLRQGSHDTYAMYSYFWQGITIQLPKPACIGVTSITYVDLTGATQTLSPNAYFVDTSSEPARIVPVPGTYWPYTQNYLPGSVVVVFQAGTYGDGVVVNTCPQTIVLAVLLLVAHWYQNREGVSASALTSAPMGVNALLDTVKFESFSFGNN